MSCKTNEFLAISSKTRDFNAKNLHFPKKTGSVSPTNSVSRALAEKNSRNSPKASNFSKQSRFPTASISLKRLLAENVANSSVFSRNLQEIQQKSLIHEGFLSSICKELQQFYQENQSETSIIAYLQAVFALFRSIRRENSLQEIDNLFESLENIFKTPFERLVRQFSEIKAVFLEKFTRNQEFHAISEEKAALEAKIKAQTREIARLREFLERKREFPGNFTEIATENEKLKQIVKQLRRTLCEKRRKDGKIMKLLNAIRAEGVDIEAIYEKNVESQENSVVFEHEAYEIKGNTAASPYDEGNCGDFSFFQEKV